MMNRMKSCWTGFTSGLKYVASNWRRFLALALGLALAYAILVPLLHPVLVWGWRYMPVFAIPAAGGLLTWYLARRKARAGTPVSTPTVPTQNAVASQAPPATSPAPTPTRRKWRIGAAPVVGTLTVLLTVATILTNTLDFVVQSQMAAALDPEELTDIPETTNSRFLPKPTAEEYARNASSDNQVKTGDPHLLIVEDTTGKRHMWWQVPQPYTVWNWAWLGSVKSTMRIDAESVEMKTDKQTGKDDFFLFGDQSLYVKWMFRMRHPFSEPSRVVYWHNADGTRQILISYKSYRPTWTGTMIPKMAGVMAIGPYGGIQNYSPAEAAERFRGAALFPPEIARAYAEAYAIYHGGIDNAMVWQKDLLEISEDPGAASELNRFPYFQDFKTLGLQQVVALEPYGDNSFALSRLLFFDAITGQARIYKVPFEKDLNGPRKALLNVINGALIPDLQKFLPIEPRLVHGPRGTFWLITVVRADSPAHPFVMMVLVEAQSLKAHAFDSSEELRKHLNGQPARMIDPDGRQ